MNTKLRLSAAFALVAGFGLVVTEADADVPCATDAMCAYFGGYNWLLNQNTNPFGGQGSATGQYVVVGGDFYPNPFPSGWSSPPDFTNDQQPFGQGTTVTASMNNGVKFPNPVTYFNAPGEPYGYFGQAPYSQSLVGAWNLQVSHPGYTTGQFTSNDTTGISNGPNMGFLPVINSINFDSTLPTATVHWTLPNIDVPTGYKLGINFGVIYQDPKTQSQQLIDFFTLPGTQTSLDLNFPPNTDAAGNPPSQALLAGNKYVIVIDAALFGNGGSLGYAQYSESISYNSFSPSNAPPPFAGPIYTPNVISGPGSPIYEFDMSVASGVTYNIDPLMAHGYIYQIGAGDPNFASVELPNIGNLNDYSLYLWENGKWEFDALLAPDTLFNFGPGGVNEFEILGINPGVDASNGNGFVTQVSFVGGGSFTGSMTAVVPEPSTWAMLVLGFAGLGYASHRARSRLSIA
jgi:hypothetical protein